MQPRDVYSGQWAIESVNWAVADWRFVSLNHGGALMSIATIPSSTEHHELLAQVQKAVHVRTGGQIRGLQVHLVNGCLVVTGRTTSYYNKQLATHAVHDTTLELSVENNVEVG